MAGHSFELDFDLGNAAFEGRDRPGEIARVLREIAGKAEAGMTCGAVYDLNGNNVGQWGFEPVELEVEHDEGGEG